MQIILGGPPIYGMPRWLMLICLCLAILGLFKLPSRAQCLVVVFPALIWGLFAFFLIGAILQYHLTFSTAVRIAIQTVGGIVVFTLVQIKLRSVSR
jgi:hypothetical protein